MSTSEPVDPAEGAQPSCDPTRERREFLRLVVQKARQAGTLVAAPVIADAFLAPKAQAAASPATAPGFDTAAQDTAGGDTTPCAVMGGDPGTDCVTDTGPGDTGCSADGIGTGPVDTGPFCTPGA
jgi:hypothetical protein